VNLLPKTEFGTYKSNNKPTVLVVWRSWLWFRYGKRELKIIGFADSVAMRLDDEFVGANGVQYKLVPAKKAKITKIGFVKNGVASCWGFDCLGEVPVITHIKDVSSSLVGGWTIQELELISTAENIVYDKATRTYKGEK